MAGLSPAWAQQACTTEVVVYVDKTESVNARDTARTVLNLLGNVPNLTNVMLFGFAGEVPVSTFRAATPPLNEEVVNDLLDRAMLQEPSSAFTLAPDYLALFSHIEQTAKERPTVANLRVYIVISDFSMRRGEAAHEGALPAALLERLASLRGTLVMRGNQRLLAIRTQARQEPSPALANDLLGEMAHNFSLVETATQIPEVMAEIFVGEPPLLLELSYNAPTGVYSLTVANPSCSTRQNIQYRTIASGIDNRLALPGCATELRPGETGACQFTPEQIVLPPLRDTCLNVWLRAESVGQAPPIPGAAGVAAAAAAAVVPGGGVIGTANDPILVGNCVFLSEVDLDATKSLATSADLAECARSAVGEAVRPDEFVACLRVRGRVEGDASRLRIRRSADPTSPLLVDRPLPAAAFNGPAFHGGERIVRVVFPLSRLDSSWLCSPAAERAERKLRIEIGDAGEAPPLAFGTLGRMSPPGAEDPLDLWRKLLVPLLLLLLLAGPVANYLKTASIGMLDAVVLVLGLGLFALLFAAYGGTGLGAWLSSLFGSASLWVATCLLALLALCYWFLFAKGFFDRQLSAQAKVSLVSRVPLSERRRRRSRRTAVVAGVALAMLAGTVALLWLDPREVSECRYRLTGLPTNTAVPPFNQPAATAAQAP